MRSTIAARPRVPTAAETAIRRRPNNARSPIRRKPPASPLPRPVDSRPRAEFAPAAAPDLPAVESRLEEDQRPNGGQTAVTSRGNARVVTLSSTQRRAPYRRLVPAAEFAGTVPITAHLPKDVRDRLKILGVRLDRTMNDLMAEALKAPVRQAREIKFSDDTRTTVG
jgi:hypothetical protein